MIPGVDFIGIAHLYPLLLSTKIANER